MTATTTTATKLDSKDITINEIMQITMRTEQILGIGNLVLEKCQNDDKVMRVEFQPIVATRENSGWFSIAIESIQVGMRIYLLKEEKQRWFGAIVSVSYKHGNLCSPGSNGIGFDLLYSPVCGVFTRQEYDQFKKKSQ